MGIERSWFCALLLGGLVLAGCRKDPPKEPTATPVTVGGSGGVYITNEGNFQFGNAKVSYYDIQSGTATEDLYQPANGVGLGDVCQSMCLFNGKGYLVVNNSGKIVVVDPQTFVANATITGFTSPRYFLPVSNNKAYVTDLYADRIWIVDLTSRTIAGSIACPGWTEELTLAFGKAFVTDKGRNKVFVIDTSTDTVVDSIVVSQGPNSIREDANGKLWVACGGGSGTSPALYRIDPASLAIEASLPFPNASDAPWKLRINSGHDTLYYLNGGVFRLPISGTALPTQPFIAAEGRNFYGLGIEPQSGVVYVSDASDYVQQGTVYRYRPDGSLANSFPAGIVPGDLCFQ